MINQKLKEANREIEDNLDKKEEMIDKKNLLKMNKPIVKL